MIQKCFKSIENGFSCSAQYDAHIGLGVVSLERYIGKVCILNVTPRDDVSLHLRQFIDALSEQ